MANRLWIGVIVALPLLSTMLTGCVVVPTHVVPPTLAGLGQLKLVVPLPTTTTQTSDAATVPWNKARLTITPVDGSSPAVTHLLESHDGNLQMADTMNAMAPGQYTVRVELLQDLASGAEVVVATGSLDGDTAAKLVPGANDLQVMVHPAQLGTHVALSPTDLAPIRHRGGGYSSSATVQSESTTWTSDVGVAVLEAVTAGVIEGVASSSSNTTPTTTAATAPARDNRVDATSDSASSANDDRWSTSEPTDSWYDDSSGDDSMSSGDSSSNDSSSKDSKDP